MQESNQNIAAISTIQKPKTHPVGSHRTMLSKTDDSPVFDFERFVVIIDLIVSTMKYPKGIIINFFIYMYM